MLHGAQFKITLNRGEGGGRLGVDCYKYFCPRLHVVIFILMQSDGFVLLVISRLHIISQHNLYNIFTVYLYFVLIQSQLASSVPTIYMLRALFL